MVRGCILTFLLALGILAVRLPVAQAETIKQPDIVPYTCEATPSIKVNFPSNGEVGKTNNLWRKTGLAVPAVGRPIYIRGRVLDKDCVPVEGAVVQIWQADNAGNYMVGEKGKKKLDPYFAGSGTTYTDNLGEYSFITIFPGADEGEVPYIRFRVKQRDFKVLTTKMYFIKTPSIEDEDYEHLPVESRALLTAVNDPNGLSDEKKPMAYYFNIILEEAEMYRGY